MSIVILGRILRVETIAYGWRIREFGRLVRMYGHGRWRKRKGIARVVMQDGDMVTAEVHGYEALGIGRREFKNKRVFD